jgi:hypothetical protein
MASKVLEVRSVTTLSIVKIRYFAMFVALDNVMDEVASDEP